MRLSLRYRLLVPLGLLLVADVAATVWAARVAAEHAEDSIRSQLTRVSRTLTEPPTFPLTPRVLEQMKGLSGAEFVLVRRNGTAMQTFPQPIELPAEVGVEISVGPEQYRVQRLALPENHPNAGSSLLIAYPESARRTAVSDAVRPAIVSGVAVGIAAILLAILASRVVSRVRKLEQRTRAIAAGDFRPTPTETPTDELADLAGSIQDMARKLLEFESALKQTERLRVLGQFSGGLAHQLRNAAAGAKLAVQLHLKETNPTDREALDVALRQLMRMETNLQQFLSLGKPGPLAKQPLDLAEVVDQQVKLHRPQCAHAGTELVWSKPSPYSFPGDPIQLGHLFGNLIGNAVEAAGPGGRVDVTLNAGVFEVIDTGPGPPAEVADRLFEPFVTGRDQGIGLGLAVAKQAAEAHGGRIEWERRDSRTVFRFAIT